ncbi:uncharacterized protein [Coffea arabica]|uniref:Uncharacterized protein isoform X1 n=1 Tax=Coffea arabica TaxID=13443 RepID=A0A6P6UJC3_COFAR|nr:uncharacterized protein LOC113711624 isoform X1 [Coffea arabica]
MRMMTSTTTSYFPLHLKTNLLVFPSNNVNSHDMNNNCCYATGRSYYSITSSGGQIKRKWVLRATSSNQGVVETSLTSLDSASTVVRKFYQGINGHDLGSVENLIAESCVYEDLIFPQPFVGRKAILDFFKKFIDSISTDLQFVIDDISEDDVSRVGVTWHLEWKRKPFPFSKGCSFYRLEVMNGQRQIIYVRDSVEPAVKPGESALVAIRGVTWLLQQFPQLAERL